MVSAIHIPNDVTAEDKTRKPAVFAAQLTVVNEQRKQRDDAVLYKLISQQKANHKGFAFLSVSRSHNCVADEANARRIESFRAELTCVNEHES